MSINSENPNSAVIDPIQARKKLESAASMHWFHWAIVSLSLVLTFFAWRYSKSSLDARVQAAFDREADRAVDLVQERMQKYEDALRGGVAMIRTSGGDVEFDQWRDYANRVQIDEQYPGINGMGVIHAVNPDQLAGYLERQRKQRPDYQIHPPHQQNVYYPISYIIPVEGNGKAVGLDMAHEANRFTAAKKARDTGESQITGPIFLVQDQEQTPGFLFYAPFYEQDNPDSEAQRRQTFKGMVYAPFVVKKLMEGTLQKEKRQVGLRLSDGDELLFDEHSEDFTDFDPDPMFKRRVSLNIYGRDWNFDIWSDKSFREASSDNQPLTILIGGILIDTLLILLFLSISRASKQALSYANLMTHQLEETANELEVNQQRLAERAQQLEDSNIQLTQFAYVASHDLQTPLRGIANMAQFLKEDYEGKLDDQADAYIDRIVGGVERMKQLINDLLAYSRIDSQGRPFETVDLNDALDDALDLLHAEIEASGAVVTRSDLPSVHGDRVQISQLLQNLVANGIKYCREGIPEVHVSAKPSGQWWQVAIQDNGIGIAPQHQERVFEIFRRLHTADEIPGTGIGLAVCRRIVDRHGGKLWLDSEEGQGSTFYFKLPAITAIATEAPQPELAAT